MYKVQASFVVLIFFILACLLMPGLPVAQEIFNETLMQPTGLASTPLGDVVVHSTIFSATLLTQFAPDRSVSNQNMIANDPFEAELLEDARLAIDPTGDAFYLLAPAGVLLVIDSALREIDRFDLLDLPVDTTNVYDANNDLPSNSLATFRPTFGDLDVFIPPDSASARIVLCSGMSNGLPFVMRFTIPSIVLTPTPIVLAPTALKVVLMSTVATPSAFNAPRGLAIAKGTGMALTTLPVALPDSMDCPDAVFKFNTLNPENTAEILPDTENRGVPSWGMTTDVQDNFYLATGGIEERTCVQSGQASVIFVPSALMEIGNSFQFGLFSSLRPQDVAVSPTTYAIYVAVTAADALVRFQPLAPVRSIGPSLPLQLQLTDPVDMR